MTTETKDLISPTVRAELEASNKDIMAKAGSLVIKTEVQNTEAMGLLSVLKAMRTKVETVFKPSVQAAKTAYDEVRGLRDTFLNPLAGAEATLRTKIGTYVQAENARRAVMQAKADEKFQKAADRAEVTGKPLTQAPVIVPKVAAPVNGGSFSILWSAEVYDIQALARAVADGTVPEAYLTANQVALNKVASALKAEDIKIPGVRGVSRTIAKVR